MLQVEGSSIGKLAELLFPDPAEPSHILANTIVCVRDFLLPVLLPLNLFLCSAQPPRIIPVATSTMITTRTTDAITAAAMTPGGTTLAIQKVEDCYVDS